MGDLVKIKGLVQQVWGRPGICISNQLPGVVMLQVGGPCFEEQGSRVSSVVQTLHSGVSTGGLEEALARTEIFSPLVVAVQWGLTFSTGLCPRSLLQSFSCHIIDLPLSPGLAEPM